MNFSTIVGFLTVLIACSGNQQTPNGELQIESGAKQQQLPKSGLLIENRINRGIDYTDPKRMDYNIRYIPITITNDSTISIHVQIVFSKEYNYPHSGSDEKFKLIPLSSEWALDGVEISESMIDELPVYIENPVLSETIEPGEKIVLAIGSLYPRSTKTAGVLPRMLFAQSDTGIFPDCEWLMEKDQSLNQQIPMGLKIIFGERCMIIPCGQVSYPER